MNNCNYFPVSDTVSMEEKIDYCESYALENPLDFMTGLSTEIHLIFETEAHRYQRPPRVLVFQTKVDPKDQAVS